MKNGLVLREFSCPAQLVRNLEHFVSRGAMDISGLGIKIVEQLAASGLVKDAADLYKLSKEDLLVLEGFAVKKAENLISGISASKDRSLARLIIGLGIRGVGEVAASDLARKFGNLEELSKATAIQLQQIEGFGPNTAQAIIDWFARPANIELIEKLHQLQVWPENEGRNEIVGSNVLEGKIFVITGTLPTFSREQAKAVIEKHGGKGTDSVSKNTDFLLVGENAGSKLDKAISLGIAQISEDDLNMMLGDLE